MSQKPLNFSLDSIMDISNEALMIVAPSMHVVAINKVGRQIVAVNAADIVGKTVENVLYGETHWSCRANLAMYEQFFNNPKPYSYVRTQIDQAGHEITVQASGRPILSADGCVFLCETMRVLLDDKRNKSNRAKKISIGQAPVYLAMLEQLHKAARYEIHVLLYGETGSGKEMATYYLHQLSTRSDKPFVVGDCTVLTESLFESELFGHEKGAFTGSAGEKKGLIEVANGGTLFLDEIGELPLSMQAKLLRVLEYGTFRRVGGTEVLQANVRIVCATNRDLLQMVKDGTFRQDLYYRLAVFPILIPPLRERREDIPLLAQALLTQVSVAMGRSLAISKTAIEKLCHYQFPGNIRELRNMLHYAATVCNGDKIEVDDLPAIDNNVVIRASDKGLPIYGRRASDGYALAQVKQVDQEQEIALSATQDHLPDGIIDAVEMCYLTELVKRYDGDKNKVAKHLGISQRTLYRRLSSMRDFLDEES